MRVARLLGVPMLVAGALGLAVCGWAWGDGSYVGNVIGWIALVWGLMFLSWGVTITWIGRGWAGVLGAATGGASALLAMWRGAGHPEWSALTGPCVVAGALAGAAGLVSFGVASLRARKARRAAKPQRSSDKSPG